ncbi:MAG: HAMP domain-containing histidine kinase [Candidatus Saganbacteria bacterium]|nr:HAMP domain-containing histidine kinase [Candidatus Saganbacteria bacterium]
MADQDFDQQALIADIKEKFYWAIMVRYALVVLGLVLVVFGSFLGSLQNINLLLVLFVLVYNFVAHLIYVAKVKFSLWGIIVLRSVFQILDVLAITFLIYITGWLESPYWFLYLVMIIISGFGMYSYSSISVFVIAFFSAVFYMGLLGCAYLRIIPMYGPNFTLTSQQLLISIYNKAIFTTVSFFLFATTIYYFSKLLNQNREQLAEKNKNLLAALEELKDTDRLKDEFVSNASHELRTPLSVIRENIALIKDGLLGQTTSEQRDLLQTTQSNIDRLANILNSLLDISKIESRSLELRRQPVNISEIAHRAVEFLLPKAYSKNLEVETHFGEKIMILADADQILRVFINLLTNAIKYSNENGHIMVGIEDLGEKGVECFVSDTGIGISQNDLPKIFERFVRFDKQKENKGAGLGLSISRGIIEMHGGKMWAVSKLGEGSRFIFRLPKGAENE